MRKYENENSTRLSLRVLFFGVLYALTTEVDSVIESLPELLPA